MMEEASKREEVEIAWEEALDENLRNMIDAFAHIMGGKTPRQRALRVEKLHREMTKDKDYAKAHHQKENQSK